MSLQTALGAVLLVGLPVMLLALGVLAHAYYIARPRSVARTDRLIEDLIAESMDQLIAELRATSSRVDASHTPPRSQSTPTTIAHSFSALAPAAAPLPATPSVGTRPQSLTSAPTFGAVNLRGAVGQLLAEGLSDRSIARRLGVGIEEVRAARMNGSTRSAA